MRHLLGINGLKKSELYQFLETSKSMVEVSDRELKKVPALRGMTIINLFLEASTRTRTSFEIAGKRLSADVINITGQGSSVAKGETLLDTARNLEAMQPNILVVRNSESGTAHYLARHLKQVAVINAGDGMNEHPTQALLDLLTLMQHFESSGRSIENLKVAIVGDIRHSRVARSNIWAHLLLGNYINLIGPPTFVPSEFESGACFAAKPGQIKIFTDLAKGLEGADVVLCLRIQLERQEQNFIPSLEEYTHEYCITEKVLARHAPDSVLIHPGPINRGIEVSSEVADSKRSLVLKQVNNSIAVRMGVLFAAVSESTQGSDR